MLGLYYNCFCMVKDFGFVLYLSLYGEGCCVSIIFVSVRSRMLGVYYMHL